MEFDQIEFTDPKQFFQSLVVKALEGKQSNFEFIRSYEMLKVARQYRSGTRKVAKVFASLHKTILKKYASAIGEDKQQLADLMSALQFDKCRDYYTKELNIVKNMIQEYRVYVESGHILFTMFGGVRSEEDCIDYRKLPVKFF